MAAKCIPLVYISWQNRLRITHWPNAYVQGHDRPGRRGPGRDPHCRLAQTAYVTT